MVAPVPSGRLIGYARVSTDDQDLTLQIRNNGGSQQDYNTWRAHFGQTTGNGSSAIGPASVVPEPTTILLLLVMAKLNVFARKRHRS